MTSAEMIYQFLTPCTCYNCSEAAVAAEIKKISQERHRPNNQIDISLEQEFHYSPSTPLNKTSINK